MSTNEREAFEVWLFNAYQLVGTWNEQRNCYEEFACHMAWNAWQARAALQSQPQADEPVEHKRRFFVYDPLDGVEFFESEELRDAYARAAIDHHREDGWSEEVGDIVAGAVTHVSTQMGRIDRPPQDELDEESCDRDGTYWAPEYHYICNYELRPIVRPTGLCERTLEAATIERCAQACDAVAAERNARGSLISGALDCVKAIRALAPQPADTLWCLHILGPDDVHPAPSREHAERAAAIFNERFGPQAKQDDVLLEAVAAPWPHDAESHAELVGNFIGNWMPPHASQPADQEHNDE